MLFNEPKLLKSTAMAIILFGTQRFSALQRAEIAEIRTRAGPGRPVLRFSALQRAEIAEIDIRSEYEGNASKFQCSSTSRNC